jgi:lysophospholipase L1-like esterase
VSRKLIFASLPLLLLLAAAELWFRAFPVADEYETNSGIVEAAGPRLIWRLRPLSSGPLATNALGLRDAPYQADAEFKILVLGDSVAWGNGIANTSDLFASRLEEELNSQGRGLSYEVINAGVPGYSTFQELAYLETVGLGLGPDLIVLQFCLNDVVERYRALARYGGNRRFLGVDTRSAARGMYGVLLRHSRAFEGAARFAQGIVRDRENYYARNLMADQLGDELLAAWALVEAELEGIYEAAGRADLPLLLLIAPYRSQLEKPRELRQPQDRLIAWAGSRRVPVIDVLAYMERLPVGAAGPLFNDNSHFSVAGHAFVAELLQVPVKRAISSKYPVRFGTAGMTRPGR